MLSQQSIKEELEQLKPSITVFPEKMDLDKQAKLWMEWLPNVSPKSLYTSMNMVRMEQESPKIYVSFDKVESENRTNVTLTSNSRDPGYSIELILRDSDIYLESIAVGPKTGNQSQAKRLLNWMSEFSENIGKPHIQALAGSRNGAYTWARFGFTPKEADWENFKKELSEYRLSPEHDRISFRNPAGTDDLNSPYMESHPTGFELKPNEIRVIEDVLKSDNPRDIWKLSDLGREVGNVALSPEAAEHNITVGKALLCGLCWPGELTLEQGNPGYERFAVYTGRSNERQVA